MTALRIGLISDTHGLLRPEATAFLAGSDRIIHAGDIGHAGILEELATLAPVTAVRGNNDHGPWAGDLPETATLAVGEVAIYILHDLKALDIDPAAAGFRAVVAGHSHRPSIAERGGVLHVNPGSAGPRRFRLPVTVGELRVDGPQVTARWVELVLNSAAKPRS
ncbi:MAG TPA: metallophosphoesterase family protein [Rhodocyclaceae bacterium]|nr:metallophosphoesterase family protein [Rhodocyclaceae bacterium]